MGMFDGFLLPEHSGVEFQTKDFACDLDWFTLTEERRLRYLVPDDERHAWGRRENGDLNQYSGTIELIGSGTLERGYSDYLSFVARVREFGKAWRVWERRRHVEFSNDTGPWLMIAPTGAPEDSHSSRWVHENNDVDFVVSINK